MKLVKIDPQLALEIRNILQQNSSIVYNLDNTQSVCLIKKKLTKPEHVERFQYEYSVIEKNGAQFVQEQTFSDKEMEYSRETAISFFLTTIFSVLRRDAEFASEFNLEEIICA